MILMMILMTIIEMISIKSSLKLNMMIRTEGRYSREGPRRSRKERFPELTPFPFLDLEFLNLNFN